MLPMLITRKKLPCDVGDDITDIARKWGFVTANNPQPGRIADTRPVLPVPPSITKKKKRKAAVLRRLFHL